MILGHGLCDLVSVAKGMGPLTGLRPQGPICEREELMTLSAGQPKLKATAGQGVVQPYGSDHLVLPLESTQVREGKCPQVKAIVHSLCLVIQAHPKCIFIHIAPPLCREMALMYPTPCDARGSWVKKLMERNINLLAAVNSSQGSSDLALGLE